MDTIRISGLELACIVGVRPAERRRRQRVRLSIALELDLSRAGVSERIVHTIDYSVVAEQVTELLCFREYRLVETATEEIAAMLLGVHRSAERVSVTLEKPEALRGRAAHGSVSIERSRGEARRTPQPFGEEERLLETADATLSILHVAPGHSLAELAARPGRRLGWLMSGELGAVPDALHDPRELERVLAATNAGSEVASVFLCSAWTD
jgi:7,8-dihydroneopterin aldolase/epimerase/oxygenase